MIIPLLNIEVKRKTNNAQGAYPFGGVRNSVLGNTMPDIRINTDLYYTLYKRNGDVWACVRERKENTGMMGWQLQDALQPDKEVNAQTYAKLGQFLDYGIGWENTKKEIVQDVSICGNAYSHLVKNASGGVMGLERIDPRQMVIVATDTGQIVKYIQRVDAQRSITFSPDEVIHWRLGTDPDAPLFGESPLTAIAIDALTDMEAATSNYVFFKNDAIPANLYLLDPELSTEEQKNAVEMITEQFKGSENRHKSAVVSGVKDIKQMGMSAKDMEFVNQRHFSTEKVCAALGVPKFILGYTDTVNNNNGTELMRKFYSGTIQPLEEYLQTVVNKKVLPALNITNVLFQFLPMEFSEQSDIERRGLEELRAGAITLREYRQKTGKEVTPDQEQNPNFDTFIVHAGTAATLLADVGLSPEHIEQDETLL